MVWTMKYNARDLEIKIDEYFKSITYDTPLMIDGEPVLNNMGEKIVKTQYAKNPTVLGLCEYLGIVRNTLIEYEKREDMSNTVMRAKQKIAEFKQGMLYELKNPSGVMFDLKFNHGWTDKQQIEHSGETLTNITIMPASAKK